MGSRLRAFGAFWYDFVIGDDWVIAVGVVLALVGTYLLHKAGVAAWWLLPAVRGHPAARPACGGRRGARASPEPADRCDPR